jgi:hypothetical protein
VAEKDGNFNDQGKLNIFSSLYLQFFQVAPQIDLFSSSSREARKKKSVLMFVLTKPLFVFAYSKS